MPYVVRGWMSSVRAYNGMDPFAEAARTGPAAVRRERVALVEGGLMPWQDFILPLKGNRNCLNAWRGLPHPARCLPFFTDLPVRVFVHDDEPGLRRAL